MTVLINLTELKNNGAHGRAARKETAVQDKHFCLLLVNADEPKGC